ncbi:MAG: acetoacetyl-CoA reductase [Alphaproteobacteria bacterium]|nr:acetoacetyl-CoA reductase [Alphaproteobacteria bacterium]
MSAKLAIVTGGTRGIGHAISLALLQAGFKVAAIYHGNEEAAKKFESETGCHAFKVDVADFAACEKGVAAIEKELGPAAVLVNNAGITRDGVLHKMEAQAWHDVLETNLSSCFNMCRFVVPGMRERNFGRIINISSINGQKGQFGQTNYAAAKAGIIGFTKALALENAAKGITVNAVCPGYIETDMTAVIRPEVLESIIKQIPAARMGKPEEIAALVAFLASDAAAFITGATLAANGGQYMS